MQLLVLEEIYKSAANVPVFIGTGMVKDVGEMYAIATEWGQDRDYTNALTEWADRMRGQATFDIYKKDPSKEYDFGDSAFYVDSYANLIASAFQFAGEGMLVGGAFGKAGTLAAKKACNTEQISSPSINF